MRTRLTAMTVLALGAALASAQEQKAAEKPKHAGFEQLRTLAGEWIVSQADKPAEGDEKTGKPADAKKDEKSAKAEQPAKTEKAAADVGVTAYKVIAAGSVVHESMFVGTPHEMVTVYHLDGDDLILTHYCAAGNQPRMKGEKSADANKLVFKFAGGTNLDPAKDAHMHDVTITFVGPDHIRQEWTFYKDGKATETEKFDLKRKK